MPQYRYRPAENRTPVADPVFGPLTYDGVYTDERCAYDERFELIPEGEGVAGQVEQELLAAPASSDPQVVPADPTPPAAWGGLTEQHPEPPAEPANAEPDEQPPAEPEQADADELGEE